MAQTKKKNRRKVRRQGYEHGGRPMQRNYGGNVQAYLAALAAWNAEHNANGNETETPPYKHRRRQ